MGAIGAMLMAGRRIGLNPRLIVFGAWALIVLALLAGAFPVRLQRSDAGPAD